MERIYVCLNLKEVIEMERYDSRMFFSSFRDPTLSRSQELQLSLIGVGLSQSQPRSATNGYLHLVFVSYPNFITHSHRGNYYRSSSLSDRRVLPHFTHR